MQRSILLAGLGALALIALVCLASRSRPGSEASPKPLPSALASSLGAAPDLERPASSEVPAQDAVRREQEVAGSMENGPAEQPFGDGRSARLVGRLTRAGRGHAGRLEFLAGPNRGLAFAVEEEGRFHSPPLFPGWALVQVEVVGERVERELRLRPTLDERFVLDFSGGPPIEGTVLGPSGEPVSGARVACDGTYTTTDFAGRFQLERRASGTSLLSVRQAGLVPYLERLPENDARPRKIRLEPGARLELTLDCAPGDGEVHVYLFPTAGERLSGRNPASAYPWHDLNPLHAYSGQTLVLEDLPHTRVDIVALHPTGRAGPHSAWLLPGESSALKLTLAPHEPTRTGRPSDPLRDTLRALGEAARHLLSQPIEILGTVP